METNLQSTLILSGVITVIIYVIGVIYSKISEHKEYKNKYPNRKGQFKAITKARTQV